MSVTESSPHLDDLLLDIAAVIELSDNDRRVAENRYQLLKEHLERPGSPLGPYLLNDESRIYAQGSMAIGATIVNGTDDDRFDVDALVELDVPTNWSPSDVLDILFEALKGFPGVQEMERCTRCVQLRFAFMHMDVTVMDPADEPREERIGDIFHSPDEGNEYRVPSNPYGFSAWVRESVGPAGKDFEARAIERRRTHGVDRMTEATDFRAAKQDDLPDSLPPHLDAEQIVALKLLKRFLNLRYEDLRLKRPPSIYLTKQAVDVGPSDVGLCAQLQALAGFINETMNRHQQNGDQPDERNPGLFNALYMSLYLVR